MFTATRKCSLLLQHRVSHNKQGHPGASSAVSKPSGELQQQSKPRAAMVSVAAVSVVGLCRLNGYYTVSAKMTCG